MKKSKTKSSKNGKSTTRKKRDKKGSEKRIKSGVRKSEQRNRKGKEKIKSISTHSKSVSKNKSRIKASRVREDDELRLLNDLFLKELQKSSNKKFNRLSQPKQKLLFERKRNKENKRLRGNVFVIIFPTKSTFQQKINLINNWDGKELYYYVDRFSKLPQAIQVILTTKKGKNTFERATRISPFDFVVNVENTKKYILEMMISFQDNYLEYVESEEPLDSDWVYDPSKIIKVTVRFIY